MQNEFEFWSDFRIFCHRLKNERRFVHTPDTVKFLKTLIATAKNRVVQIKSSDVYWRAQIGYEFIRASEISGYTLPFGKERMKPTAARVGLGRSGRSGVMVGLGSGLES